MGNQRICELCSKEAVVYCQSDSAFLCFSCDSNVHRANFLVARHLRQVVCSNCQDFTGVQISGVLSKAKASICPVCSPEELDSGSLSSSSCISSSFCDTTTKKKKRGGGRKPEVNGGQRVKWGIDSKTVGIFVNWCKRLGLNVDVVDDVVRMACNGLTVCGGKMTGLPFRISLVASMWFGLKFSRMGSLSGLQGLARLEHITGIPVKLISAAESRIEGLYRSTKQRQYKLLIQNYSQDDQLLKEGWAESS